MYAISDWFLRSVRKNLKIIENIKILLRRVINMKFGPGENQ